MIDKLFFRIQLVCSTLNPIQGFMENHMHSGTSVKYVLGVQEWCYVVPEKRRVFLKWPPPILTTLFTVFFSAPLPYLLTLCIPFSENPASRFCFYCTWVNQDHLFRLCSFHFFPTTLDHFRFPPREWRGGSVSLCKAEQDWERNSNPTNPRAAAHLHRRLVEFDHVYYFFRSMKWK